MSSYTIAAAELRYEDVPQGADPTIVPARLLQLLREGWGALLLAFILTGSQSLVVGSSQFARRAVVINGFAIVLVGMFVARTLGGRAILALGYLILYEHNYFMPPHIHIISFQPSMFLAILALLMEAVRPWRTRLIEPADPAMRAATKIVYACLLLALLTAQLFSRYPTVLLLDQYLQHYIYAIPFVLLGARLVRTRELAQFADGLIFLGVLVAVGIYAYFLFDVRILFYEELVRREYTRYGGLIRTANEASFFMGLCLVLAVMRLRGAAGLMKILLPVFAVALGGAMIHTRSRGPVALVALTFLVFVLRRRWRRPASWMLVLGGAGIVLLVSLGVAGLSWKRLVERFVQIRGGAAIRLDIMKESLRSFTNHPFGLGESQVYMVEANVGTLKVEHNEYINFLLRGGWQSQVPLWVLVAMFVTMWRQARQNGWPNRPNSFVKIMLMFYLLTFFYEHLLVISISLNRLFHMVVGMVAASLFYAVPQADDYAYEEAVGEYAGEQLTPADQTQPV